MYIYSMMSVVVVVTAHQAIRKINEPNSIAVCYLKHSINYKPKKNRCGKPITNTTHTILGWMRRQRGCEYNLLLLWFMVPIMLFHPKSSEYMRVCLSVWKWLVYMLCIQREGHGENGYEYVSECTYDVSESVSRFACVSWSRCVSPFIWHWFMALFVFRWVHENIWSESHRSERNHQSLVIIKIRLRGLV